MWTSDAERANQSDAFEIRGETRGAETLDATIKLVMVGMNERYRVGKDMAELIGDARDAASLTIAELWTYFTVNGLVNEDDVSMVKPDAPMVEVLERAGFDGLKEGQVVFRDVCEFVLGKLLMLAEPAEIKYKIKTTGLSPSKPDCYDIEVHCPKAITSGVNRTPNVRSSIRSSSNARRCDLHARAATNTSTTLSEEELPPAIRRESGRF